MGFEPCKPYCVAVGSPGALFCRIAFSLFQSPRLQTQTSVTLLFPHGTPSYVADFYERFGVRGSPSLNVLFPKIQLHRTKAPLRLNNRKADPNIDHNPSNEVAWTLLFQARPQLKGLPKTSISPGLGSLLNQSPCLSNSETQRPLTHKTNMRCAQRRTLRWPLSLAASRQSCGFPPRSQLNDANHYAQRSP